MVKLKFRDQEYHVPVGLTLRQALEKCDINPHMVLALRRGKLVTDDVVLKDGDEITLVAVISGG